MSIYGQRLVGAVGVRDLLDEITDPIQRAALRGAVTSDANIAEAIDFASTVFADDLAKIHDHIRNQAAEYITRAAWGGNVPNPTDGVEFLALNPDPGVVAEVVLSGAFISDKRSPAEGVAQIISALLHYRVVAPVESVASAELATCTVPEGASDLTLEWVVETCSGGLARFQTNLHAADLEVVRKLDGELLVETLMELINRRSKFIQSLA